jgi:hypothetical protein
MISIIITATAFERAGGRGRGGGAKSDARHLQSGSVPPAGRDGAVIV